MTAVRAHAGIAFTDVVEEHFDELDFLWTLRERVLFARDWNVSELADLEARIEAHRDGLRLAGDGAVELARPRLASEDGSMATGAALALCDAGDETARDVLAALQSAAPAVKDRLRLALRHADISAIKADLEYLAQDAEPLTRACAADVLAFQRMAPREPRDLTDSADAQVAALALGVLGRTGAAVEPRLLEQALKSKSARVRRAALEAAARAGCPEVERLCRAAAFRSGDPDPVALEFVGCFGNKADLTALCHAAAHSELAARALAALGALGSTEAIAFVVEHMTGADPIARAAGAAFTRITAIAIAQPGEARSPEPVEGQDLAELEALPLPDARRAAEVWKRRQADFDAKRRWQWALEVPPASLPSNLDQFPLACRRDIYFAARAKAGRAVPEIELEQFARRQRAQ